MLLEKMALKTLKAMKRGDTLKLNDELNQQS